jgi:hypothetical protein
MHARILECQKLRNFVPSEAREVQGFLIHPAREVLLLSIVCKLANNFR